MSNGKVKIMGIVNVNDDSFFPESRANSTDCFRRRVDSMLESGADIIDIGAVSSRPGSSEITAEDEWNRLEPVLNIVAKDYAGYSFSIDTFRASVVIMAYQIIGRFIVNDISAGEWDEAMLPTVGRLHLRYVAMHHKGTFTTMHDDYNYDDITGEVRQFFENFSVRAKEAGIEEWILDPGFGFSKNKAQNLELLKHLDQFKLFRRPLLVGVSHKRFTDGKSEEIENIAISKGATIIRKH